MSVCSLALVVSFAPSAQWGLTERADKEKAFVPLARHAGSGSEHTTAGRSLQSAATAERVDGHGLSWWVRRARWNGSQMRRLERVVRFSTSVDEAIDLAAVTWHVDAATLHRKAFCESHKYARARNLSSGAAGLFQFLGSTWRSTPYARFNVYSTYANALAAGYMHHVGRGGEWVCR